MTEKPIEYASEEWLEEEELGEMDVPVEYQGDGGKVLTKYFRIKQINELEYERLVDSVISVDETGKLDGDVNKLRTRLNDAVVIHCTIKPKLSQQKLDIWKRKKSPGIYTQLLMAIQSFCGLSPSQIQASKNLGSPESC